jgi:transposase
LYNYILGTFLPKGAYIVVATDNDNNTILKVLITDRSDKYSQQEEMLKIECPYYINDIKLDSNNYEQHIYIKYHKSTTFTSSCCGEENCKIHKVHPRIWRHLDSYNYKTFIHMDIPVVRCPKCNSTKVIDIPWARKSCRFTHEFEQRTIAFAERMPISSASKFIGESDIVIANHVHNAVEEARKDISFKDLEILGIDETSKSKGHNYITTFVDLQKRKVVYIEDGKDKSVIHKFVDELIKRCGHPNQIKEIAMDMSKAFIAGVKEAFPDVQPTYDKFHNLKMANTCVNQVRIEEAKVTPALKGTKFLWLHNYTNLSKKQYEILINLSKRNLKTARAYRFKLSLQEIYRDCSYEEAIEQIKKLIGWGQRSRLEPLKAFAKTLKTHFDGVLRYFKSGLTSGVIEGLNTKIQEVKRRSRGFPNLNHFKNMIYLVCGDLKIPKLYGTGKATT